MQFARKVKKDTYNPGLKKYNLIEIFKNYIYENKFFPIISFLKESKSIRWQTVNFGRLASLKNSLV